MSKLIKYLKTIPPLEGVGKLALSFASGIFIFGIAVGATGNTYIGIPARTTTLEEAVSIGAERDEAQDSTMRSFLNEWRASTVRDSVSDWTNNCILWRHIDGLPITRRDCDPNATSATGEAQ